MYNDVFCEEDYDQNYITSRREVDRLCDLIVEGKISAGDAKQIYTGIQREFTRSNPEKAEMFSMIYESRIKRLCHDFQAEASHGN
jgi:hypothetical protein